ncbi:MAG: O-acetylhomoserine aminocarboxypropyltransferase [Proteobacteria bacterium]|nr:O-acetylhomoserine aminocarboxypropyltransferase [Pseudomonadota bacterium]
MADPKFLKFDTRALHAGQRPDPVTGARAVPIYQTTSYVFRDTDHAAALFNLERAGYLYSRISNPTVAVLEERVAALEHGVGAVATASGQAALHLGIATLMGQGAHVVASASLYGGSINVFAHTMPRFGIETSFVKPRDLDGFRAAIRPETRLVYAETLGNPGLEVLDIPAVAEIAHAAGLPLMIDNTFATPYLCRPLAWGATIVVHSATKFIGGHGNSIGGVIADAGEFDFSQYPTIAAPSPSYHGLRFFDTFGHQAFLMKARVETLRDTGACLSPFNAFLLLQGLETLSVRMDRHVANAQAVAEFLEAHPQVDEVAYPGLPDNPYHDLAQKYLPKGPGAIFSFGVKAGPDGARAAGKTFIEALQLFSHLANVGDAKSLVIHPASTTHSQLGKEELAAGGVSPEMIRLSVGLEDIEDILWDLDQALEAGRRKSEAPRVAAG